MLRERLEREIRTHRDAGRPDPVQGRDARRPGAERVARVRRLRQARGRARPADQGSAGAWPSKAGWIRRPRTDRTGNRLMTVSRFYITTPIYYINAEPHLGPRLHDHGRRRDRASRRLLGDDVFFLTGTDEHGQKVERAARSAALEPQAFADRMAAKFRDVWPALDISNDDFIRTTEPRHTRAAPGDLAPGARPRAISTRPLRRLVLHRRRALRAGEAARRRPLCRPADNAVERTERGELLLPAVEVPGAAARAYREHPEFITPEIRRNEMTAFVDGRPARTLSVSRAVVQVGHPGARRSRARHVRVVRRADELPDRGGLSGPTRRGSRSSGRPTCT